MSCYILKVGPRYFETMKMPILAGRDFGPQDDRPLNQHAANSSQNNASAPPLHAVINQTMASRFFGNENPVGKRFIQGGHEMEIIGVAKGSKYTTLREPASPTFYLYYFQQPSQFGMTLQLRTDSDKIDYAAAIQRLARETDPQLQVFNLKTLTDVVDETLVQERFIAQVASSFSLVALLLTCVGLYGVMSYTVTRRTSEIGIRMALGAQRADVIRLVMREVLLLVAVGIGIGLAAALGTTRYVATLLYDLAPNDPVTIAMATLLLIGVAALAGYLPARRATMVDPLISLRCE
jgi:putative ABC transport system permease protein